MALITCPDCQNDISDKAPSCIRCGRQFVATTIEKTSKNIKAAKAAGVVCMLFAMLTIIGGSSAHSMSLVAVGMLLFLAGGPLYIGASLLKWWRHD